LEYRDQLHLEEAAWELLDVNIEDSRTLGLSWALSFFCSFLYPVGVKQHFCQALFWPPSKFGSELFMMTREHESIYQKFACP
jgi:hypothetical protein